MKARLQDPLLDGALRLFALIAQQENIPPAHAVEAVHAHLQVILPGQTAARLDEYFRALLETAQNSGAVYSQLQHASDYPERVYILLKVLEFRRYATPDHRPGDLSDDLLVQVGIRKPDLEPVRAINRGGEISIPLPDADARVHLLPVFGSNQPRALWLPVPGVDVLFVAVVDTYYVVRRGDHPLRIGRSDAPANVFLRIQEDERVALGGRHVSAMDLRYYFRQATRPRRESNLQIRVEERATVIGAMPNQTADAWLDLSGVAPVVHATDPTKSSLEVNGHHCTDATPVWLSDRFSCRQRLLDLRKLIPYADRDTFVFEGPDARCTVSSEPQAAIYIQDRAAHYWAFHLEAGEDGVRLLPEGCPHPMQVHGRPVLAPVLLREGDFARVAGARLLIERHAGGMLQVTSQDDRFSTVEVRGVAHRFAGGATALDDISFELQRGDLVCVLGPSGCGKTTLLNVLNGAIRPKFGDVLLDGASLFAHPALRTRVGYVPQDDLLQENFTVEENLLFAARLRWPQESAASHRLLVEAALTKIDLREQCAARVGNALDKSLSGGQRKRVNIGLELVGSGDLLLLDEPTSGLSSGDTRKIVEVLRQRADDGNIVLAVAHQPSARVLATFDKVLVLDKGGRLAFFGSVEGCYRYFEQTLPSTERSDHAGALPDPGMFFEALEQSKLRIDGSPGEERRYPPTYWKGRYLSTAHRYQPIPLREAAASDTARLTLPGDNRAFLRRGVVLLARECLNKVRGRMGWIMQLLSATFLGSAAALACRISEDAVYSYNANKALPNYMFLTVIVCLFLAVSGSVQEIIRDRAIRLRERMLDIPFTAYLASKFTALFLIYLSQLTLYLLVGFWILKIPELFGAWWLFLAIVGCTGIALGLAISAVPKLSERAAAVLVPLVIIPQIILSGADPFPFADMNHLKFHPDSGNSAPAIAEIIPSRWALEGLIALHRDHDLKHSVDEQAASLRPLERKSFQLLPSGILRRNDPAAYAQQYGMMRQDYERRNAKLLTPDRVALFRLIRDSELSTAQPDPDIHPIGDKMALTFANDPVVRKRVPPRRHFPGVTRDWDVAGFDAVVLLSFAAVYLVVAALFQGYSPALPTMKLPAWPALKDSRKKLQAAASSSSN